MSDPVRIDRDRIADRFDRYARRSVLMMIPIALIVAVDLPTGWLTGDRRIDIAMVAAVAMGLWGSFSLRRLARRFRAGDLPARPTPQRWIGLVASMVLSLGFTAGVGYLIGGWVLAVVLPAATVTLMAASIAVGIRRRRRVTSVR